MARRKHGDAIDAPPPRFVKRSITIRPDLDQALREIAGNREYSQVVNEALLLYVQARGIDRIVAEIEAESGPITAEVLADVDRRIAEAHRRAEQRARSRH
jgi:O-methyltransferase involved in polyketide biosynthesis